MSSRYLLLSSYQAYGAYAHIHGPTRASDSAAALAAATSCMYCDDPMHVLVAYEYFRESFPAEVVARTLLHKSDNSDGELISINVLEFVTVIINYCAAVHVITMMKPTDDPHPVILNITDNVSASNWTSHACLQLRIGRLLGRLLCFLLMDSPVGINSKWISTVDNEIADDISRVKNQSTDLSPHPSFDYSSLVQRYPALKSCTSFQIEPELLSLIWEIVLTGRWPQLESIWTLKLKPLGKLIT